MTGPLLDPDCSEGWLDVIKKKLVTNEGTLDKVLIHINENTKNDVIEIKITDPSVDREIVTAEGYLLAAIKPIGEAYMWIWGCDSGCYEAGMHKTLKMKVKMEDHDAIELCDWSDKQELMIFSKQKLGFMYIYEIAIDDDVTMLIAIDNWKFISP